jgi:DNA polymerase III subunit alpha
VYLPQSIFVRVHSYFSILDGLYSPTELATRAAQLGYRSLALTDRAYLTGAIEFYEACHTVGIQPIIGLTLPVRLHDIAPTASSGELVLLAKDVPGWSNLCRLCSALLTQLENIQHNSIPFSMLASHGQGLICLIGADLGLFMGDDQRLDHNHRLHVLHRLLEIFPGQVYLETPCGVDETSARRRLHSSARRLSITELTTHVVYQLDPSDTELRRVATAIRLNTPVTTLPQPSNETTEWLLPLSDLNTLGIGTISNPASHLEIEARCHLELPLYQPRFPELDLPPGETPKSRLHDLAYAGAMRLYGSLTSEIDQRLKHELAIIADAGYSALFLIMAEIIAFARQADIPTASRGSASSSLVAHCLDITTPDPVHHNLYFERFLNPARRTPPDVDTDVCSVRRDELIRFVGEKFGTDHVAMAATINRFRTRSALREVAKAYGVSQSRIRKMVDELPWRGWGPLREADTRPEPYHTLREKYPSPVDQSIFSLAASLRDHPHHLSVHPGGVIISPTPLTDLLPTAMSNKGVVITQFNLDGIEKLGLVKIDLLGIRGLTVLGEVADNLRKPQTSFSSTPARSRLDVLDNIPHIDEATSQLVSAGETIGCFQIESPGMRATLRAIQAHTIDDIMVALALYRPGPMTGGLKEAFIRRHLRKEPVSHLHSALAPLLDDTYGVILYQEQVLRIAHELAGLSLADADLLRRAMSHFDPGKQMESLKQRFLEGALVKSQVPAEIGERIWDLMAAFAGYGFPKAHAASYAQVAWRSAWCKAHFPAHFLAAVLANWGGYYTQRVYIQEARRLGIRISAPNIHHSKVEFCVRHVDGEAVVFMGLDQVRDLTRQTIERITALRPFDSLAEFTQRVRPRPQELDNLIRCGALAGFGTIPALLDAGVSTGLSIDPRQLPLFPHEHRPSQNMTEDWTPEQRAAAQEAILGISIDVHPLELVALSLASANVISTSEAAGRLGERVRIAGIRQFWRRSRTLDGEPVVLLTLEDMQGSLVVTLARRVYQQYRKLFTHPQPLILEGIVQPDEETADIYLRAEKVWTVD